MAINKLKLIEATTLPEDGEYALPNTVPEHVVPVVPRAVSVITIPFSVHKDAHAPVIVKPFVDDHE